MNKNGRFIKGYVQTTLNTKAQVLIDKETGVNYLYYAEGSYGGGLTPLLDRDGKPVITTVLDL